MHASQSIERTLFVRATSAALRTICAPAYRRLIDSSADPRSAQNAVLKRRIASLSKTEFGIRHGLTEREDYAGFARKIPLQDYDTLRGWIEKQIAFPNQAVISTEPIIHVEPTSGSSGPKKLIPYTKSLRNSFTNMFCVWAFDMLAHDYRPETGRLFISVSPESDCHKERTGFSSDADYLSEPLRSLLSPFLVVPNSGTKSFNPSALEKRTGTGSSETNSNRWTWELAVRLLAAPDLEVISIWSPSYLLVLLQYIAAHRFELVDAADTGICNRVKQLLRGAGEIAWQSLWPDLKVISCWDSAHAGPLARQLKSIFPNVLIQGKGLLSTECPMTVPLLGSAGRNTSVPTPLTKECPLLNDVFFEFLCTESDQIYRLHELELGRTYEIVVTQSAGLTRYRMNDLIVVEGFLNQTPLLKFIGRSNNVVDMVGEKLHDRFVFDQLVALVPSGRFILVPSCMTVVPNVDKARSRDSGVEQLCAPAGYTLLIDEADLSAFDDIHAFAQRADKALCAGFHYGLARSINQLNPTKVISVSNLLQFWYDFSESEGVKVGDAKNTTMICDLDKASRILSRLNLRTVQTAIGSPVFHSQTPAALRAR